MTTHEEVLKLAIEALEDYGHAWPHHVVQYTNAITAIKEALAQQSNEQVEPVAWIHEDQNVGYRALEWKHDVLGYCGVWKKTPLYTHPPVPTAQPKEPEQEPYGYFKFNTGKFYHEVEGCNPKTDKRYLPLYRNPPQRKPLTYVELRRIANQCGLGASEVSAQAQAKVDNFARAIEAAHGIKGAV